MKLKFIFPILFITAATFSSCKKCVVCVPYHYDNNTLGSVDDNYATGGTQAIKLCNKRDIDSYENGTNFQDEGKHPVKFICQ